MSATMEAFQQKVTEIQDSSTYPGNPDAFALGLVRYDGDTVLDVRFPTVNYRENNGSAAIFWEAASKTEDGSLRESSLMAIRAAFSAFRSDGKRHANIDAVITLSSALSKQKVNSSQLSVELIWIDDLSLPAKSTQDVWLRLHLLSHRKVLPNSINLEGIFGKLQTIAWTNRGPVLASKLDDALVSAMVEGYTLHVTSLDKFPPLLDYVSPPGVRIADAVRARLGAYLSPGTTMMHEGFVNYNAGTLGESMVEGRISQGVVVGNGSDIGGGASIMGTLSGGGTHKVSIGERCLLGANSGLGISLGDDCVVEAGLYLTAGTKVRVKLSNWLTDYAKASELSGVPGILFRRNSITGEVEALPRHGNTVELNTDLHAN